MFTLQNNQALLTQSCLTSLFYLSPKGSYPSQGSSLKGHGQAAVAPWESLSLEACGQPAGWQLWFFPEQCRLLIIHANFLQRESSVSLADFTWKNGNTLPPTKGEARGTRPGEFSQAMCRMSWDAREIVPFGEKAATYRNQQHIFRIGRYRKP